MSGCPASARWDAMLSFLAGEPVAAPTPATVGNSRRHLHGLGTRTDALLARVFGFEDGSGRVIEPDVDRSAVLWLIER